MHQVLSSIRAQLCCGGRGQVEEVLKLERVCVGRAPDEAWHSGLRHSPLVARRYMSPPQSSKQSYYEFSIASTAISGAQT